jgi:ABC-2 type transport system ATP-binding protein
MIDLERVTKTFGGRPVLHRASLHLPKGAISVLIGENGSGKTTTLRIVAGLTRPDEGSVRVDGINVVQDRRGAQVHLSFLPQGAAFSQLMTARSLLHFYANVRGCRRDRAEYLLEKFDLGEVAEQPVGSLSGGVRQRVGLALLFLPDAPVLLLDEPGISLDVRWRDRLREKLESEAARGKSVVVTTHLPQEWEMADHCFCCVEGSFVEVDPATFQSGLHSTADRARRSPPARIPTHGGGDG